MCPVVQGKGSRPSPQLQVCGYDVAQGFDREQFVAVQGAIGDPRIGQYPSRQLQVGVGNVPQCAESSGYLFTDRGRGNPRERGYRLAEAIVPQP